MIRITPYRCDNTAFGGHLPRDFASMMNYIYKKKPNVFENNDIIQISTKLDDGTVASGIAYFSNGRYKSFVMDEGFENRKQEFIKTTYNNYIDKTASSKVKEKLKTHRNIKNSR